MSSYDQLELEFYVYPKSMENGEDFWVRYPGLYYLLIEVDGELKPQRFVKQ